MIQKESIIYQLYPDAVWTSKNGDTYLVKDEDGNSITIDQDAVDAEFIKQDYKNKREYPLIKDQLDQLYWDKKNGTNKWVESIDKVKSDNPKP
jgi:hypothetical protein